LNAIATQSERALILAPTGRDATLTMSLLAEAGVCGHVCAGLGGLCEELACGAGLAIVADEALRHADLEPLAGFLETQPAWSDLPIILLTRGGIGAERNPAALRLAQRLGNVSFLERPFHPATLGSLVRAALRARRRQYEAGLRLEELSVREQQLQAALNALSDLTRTLEQRVTERTHELMKAQEQLLQSQKMESVGQLTGGIAHDFNNLLMAVMGNLEILRKRVPEEPGLRRLIDGAVQGAQRGASLTQRMLAFARQQDLKTTAADLGALVGGMEELLVRSLGPHIDLHLHVEPDLPPAQVDANQLELALLNLAINARDAMPDGGLIDIRVDQRHSDGGDQLRPGNYLRVQLADTGVGMDAATLGRAVEPFFSTKPPGKGTGLGLSMTHGLAVQLGGRLELSSERGVGTVATLWLPMASQPAAAVAHEAAPAPANRSATILVVDDDPLIAMSTVDMLEDLGHVVIEANSGERALEILDGGRQVDIVMTDQAMPGMTGMQLAEIVRSKRPHLPVLLATGYADLPAGQLANLPRLSKPYQQSQLQAQIEKLLDPAW
jgi:signal transduction histidine kinase/CheY-like chemotaxis protein